MSHNEWVLDVSLRTPCFVPYDSETGMLMTGMNLISDCCPGHLVGVFHEAGVLAATQWTIDHPDWREQYKGKG